MQQVEVTEFDWMTTQEQIPSLTFVFIVTTAEIYTPGLSRCVSYDHEQSRNDGVAAASSDGGPHWW